MELRVPAIRRGGQRVAQSAPIPRLIELPGVGAEAAQQILAEIGPGAAAFPSAGLRWGYPKAILAIAHRLCRILWNVLQEGARFIEYGEAVNPKAVRRAIHHHLNALRRLGHHIPGEPASGIPG